MSEYRVDDDTVLFHVVDGDERTIATFKPTHLWAANHMVDTLNTETATLRDELTAIQTALEAQSELIAKLLQFRNRLQGTIKWQEKKLDKLQQFIRDFASADAIKAELLQAQAMGWVKAWDSASEEAQESETDTITLSGAVYSLKLIVTQRNETMASFTIDRKKIVVFPKSWLQYRSVIDKAWVSPRKPSLSCIVKPDDSRGEVEYILQSIEGVEPDALPASEESQEE